MKVIHCVLRPQGTCQVSRLDCLAINLYEPCVLYIGRANRYTPDVVFYIFFSPTISTEYFKNAEQSPFFSSKCHLFHNATLLGSCIIHNLHTGCAKI
jgi:hypothetical protein